MEKYINFEFEYFQDELLNLHSDNTFPNIFGEENIMNDFPSVCEIDTTEVVKKKMASPSKKEINSHEFSLVPEVEDPYIMHYEAPFESNTSLFAAKTAEKEKIKEEETCISKDVTS